MSTRSLKGVHAHTVAEIFDGRTHREADVSQTAAALRGRFGIEIELNLTDGVYDAADGYVKWRKRGTHQWVWVRLNGADLYDVRLTRFDTKNMVTLRLPVGEDDVPAENLFDVVYKMVHG